MPPHDQPILVNFCLAERGIAFRPITAGEDRYGRLEIDKGKMWIGVVELGGL